MEINPESLHWNSVYKLMIGSIVPRPIGWISTVSMEGGLNLAPFSFFNAVCPNPPTVLFCPNIRGLDGAAKDTLSNVRATGEFVVNIVTEELAQVMNFTSTEFPPEVNEFKAAGLTPAPSLTVRPPRVAESPIHYECRLSHILDISTQPGGGSIIVGQVLHMHVADSVLVGTDKVDIEKLKPVGRLAGKSYCRISDIFEMTRPPSRLQNAGHRED
jgi:flavin reductase (DIM6/NTAB) family NADH-FMN oxidoreductase RutF